jgi:Putative Ig domain
MLHFAPTCHARQATLALMLLSVLAVSGCGGGGSSSDPTPPPPPPPTPVAVTTKALPVGQVGNPYTATLAATGGTTPYTWALASGTLPSGLSLNAASGALAGFPTIAVAGVSIAFTVTDSSKPARSATATLPLTIADPLNITSNSLPNGQIGSAYSAFVGATGGTTPYKWSLSSGTLPAGLSLNAATGAISGTPTAAVTGAALVFLVTDASSPLQSTSMELPLTISPLPLSITSSALPGGQLNAPYSATLTATGGTTPYKWSLTSGALPTGLSLSSAGVISGTPTVTAASTPLTLQVSDAGGPQQTQAIVLPLTIIDPSVITVAIAPARAALTVTQTLTVSAATNDPSGVNWSFSGPGGSISVLSSTSARLTAPATAGIYTLTATSVMNPLKSSSISVAVSDLPGVYTYHNDLGRDGLNAQEYALTTATVNTGTFGKLFSCTVDGAVFAQPLWVANAAIGGAQHNVVIVATQHDSVYAFDADANTSPCAPLWHVSLIDAAHGGSGAETSVPSLPTCHYPNCYIGVGLADIQPEVGITSTPVIDPAAGTLYVVSKSVVAGGNPPSTATFYERLHGIDLGSGAEKPNSPVALAATASYPGPVVNGNQTTVTVTFSPRQQNQRAGLALVNGTVYVASGSHEDTSPYYGWVLGYTYSSAGFTPAGAYCTTPNAANGGIWMAGGAPSADAAGHLYLISSNGQFDVTNTTPPNNDYGDSFLALAAGGTNGLMVASYFTPSDESTDFPNDADAGSGGAAMVVNNSSGQPLVIGGGKDGTVYVLNGSALGGFGDANAVESFSLGAPGGPPNIFSTAAFWNNNFYIAAAGMPLKSFPFNPASATPIGQPWTSQAPNLLGFPGATPSVSASGTSNGIVWLLDTTTYCTNGAQQCAAAVLHAYDATNLASELWNSTLLSADAAGFAVKFTVPTVANGKVYVGTRGNNLGGVDTSTSAPGELDVYGLKPN